MMDKNLKLTLKVFGIFMLVCLTLVPFAAIAKGEVKTGQDVLMCLAFLSPNLALLYWPIKRHLAHLQRTAPERERARETARQQTEDRNTEQKRLREEKAAKTQVENEVNTVRAEVESFYQANAESLRDVLPPSLFRSELQTSFPAGISVSTAWSVARDMLALIQPIVQKGQERQRQEQERLAKRAEQVRKIQDEISAHEAEIKRLRASSLDPDAVEDETDRLQEAIEKLQQQQRELVQTTR